MVVWLRVFHWIRPYLERNQRLDRNDWYRFRIRRHGHVLYNLRPDCIASDDDLPPNEIEDDFSYGTNDWCAGPQCPVVAGSAHSLASSPCIVFPPVKYCTYVVMCVHPSAFQRWRHQYVRQLESGQPHQLHDLGIRAAAYSK